MARARLTSLLHMVKKVSLGTLKQILSGYVVVWRNKIKSSLYYFMQRILFPLKELDIEGRQYLVSLENFPDSSIDQRTFTVHQEYSGYGDFENVRGNLRKVVESINRDIDASMRVILTVADENMDEPLRRKRLEKILKTSESVKEIAERLEDLASTTEAELDTERNEKKRRKLTAHLITTMPLKEWVLVKSLLFPMDD